LQRSAGSSTGLVISARLPPLQPALSVPLVPLLPLFHRLNREHFQGSLAELIAAFGATIGVPGLQP